MLFGNVTAKIPGDSALFVFVLRFESAICCQSFRARLASNHSILFTVFCIAQTLGESKNCLLRLDVYLAVDHILSAELHIHSIQRSENKNKSLVLASVGPSQLFRVGRDVFFWSYCTFHLDNTANSNSGSGTQTHTHTHTQACCFGASGATMKHLDALERRERMAHHYEDKLIALFGTHCSPVKDKYGL